MHIFSSVAVTVCLHTHRSSMKPKIPLTSWSLERRFLLSTKPAERRKRARVCVRVCVCVCVCLHVDAVKRPNWTAVEARFFSLSVLLPHLCVLNILHRFCLCHAFCDLKEKLSFKKVLSLQIVIVDFSKQYFDFMKSSCRRMVAWF